ncbi:hypothetical protein ACH5RR_025012 [Cinchona calisaya]|uniref:Uncharacterized protein n=1 Tax=Cinchona calisaya TaxID=153742 RepID=A0ABD2Z1S9_9GENT
MSYSVAGGRGGSSRPLNINIGISVSKLILEIPNLQYHLPASQSPYVALTTQQHHTCTSHFLGTRKHPSPKKKKKMAIEDVGVAGDASMTAPSGTAAPSPAPAPASVVLDCRSHYNGLKKDKKDLCGKLLMPLGFYITCLAIAFVGSIGEKPDAC